ncbi:uncharacterized protein LOC100898142 [Galendromus occidentalis]|uniref:Uncharacterized protein LOC100898142 n=1 Tax=Galendromus occidentalis TaxID=34638 RepID=A0AAJ6QX09_9ACAR|nr:uncharacterized protein LOC100898142 [Galendromus occidentalis]
MEVPGGPRIWRYWVIFSICLGTLSCDETTPSNDLPIDELLNAPSYSVKGSDHEICPPGYTFLPSIHTRFFAATATATRIRALLDDYSQLQCVNSPQCHDSKSIPGAVVCLLNFSHRGAEWNCTVADDSTKSIANAVVECEHLESFFFCVLDDSCILRFELGSWNTWKTVAVATGAVISIGIIGVFVAWKLRQR